MFRYWLFHVAIPLRTARVLRGVLQAPDPVSESVLGAGDPARFVPSPEYVAQRFDPLDRDTSLGGRALRRAVLEIARESDRLGARLVLFDIGYPAAFSAAVESLAAETGARYSDAGRVVLARAQRGEDVYLARDGHWSPRGSDAIARRLAEQVTEGL